MLAASGSSNVILGVVAGGIIGFISSIGTAAFADYRKLNEERRRFAALAAGSLSGVLHHLKSRNVVQHLANAAQAARMGNPPNTLLIIPIRGAFLETFGKLESSMGLLPPQTIGRASRAIILIRSLIEDFTTLFNRGTSQGSHVFADLCDTLISEIKEIETIIPDLVEELGRESRTDRDILTGGSY